MIITFFGHRDFRKGNELKAKVLSILEEYGKSEPIEFFLGGHGSFDVFAHSCAKEYKKQHPDTKLIFVTPYLNENYLKRHSSGYDETLFPDLEKTLPQFRIIKRNEYMVDKADIIITFVTVKCGGAYNTSEYARKKSKTIINLA